MTDSNFSNILVLINDDLNAHKGRAKQELMKEYITDRLNKSLKQYYRDLSSSITYLENKDSKNLLRKLNKGDNTDGTV